MGNRGGLSRERFFSYAFIAATCWYFVPGYLFAGLSYFSWVCWIAPENVKVNAMFGYVHGLGMSLLTFDWAQVCHSFQVSEVTILTTHVRSHISDLPSLPHGGLKPTLQLVSSFSSVSLLSYNPFSSSRSDHLNRDFDTHHLLHRQLVQPIHAVSRMDCLLADLSLKTD